MSQRHRKPLKFSSASLASLRPPNPRNGRAGPTGDPCRSSGPKAEVKAATQESWSSGPVGPNPCTGPACRQRMGSRPANVASGCRTKPREVRFHTSLQPIMRCVAQFLLHQKGRFSWQMRRHCTLYRDGVSPRSSEQAFRGLPMSISACNATPARITNHYPDLDVAR